MSLPDYKAFAQWAIREGSWNGCALDGGMVQDKAVECGIIKEVKFDPDIHGPRECGCEPGDPWFVFVEE